jgi:hypothetical protein
VAAAAEFTDFPRFCGTINTGDVDGDGLGDMLIGGRGDADGGAYAGAVWLISGATLPGER